MYRVFLVVCLAGCARGRSIPRVVDTEVVEELVMGRLDRMGPGLRRQLFDSASAAHARWQQSRPRSYELRVVERGGCVEIHTRDTQPPLRPVYYIVGDSIAGQRLGVIADSLGSACWQPWTADSLFGRIFEALKDSDSVLGGVVFDSQYGIPRTFDLDRGGHGSARIMVDHFTVVPR